MVDIEQNALESIICRIKPTNEPKPQHHLFQSNLCVLIMIKHKI